ncbi:MAG: MarR family transcriptional regulator [Muriicola sp.]|nr:MarR family transcriptional regulator [Muriicola sp.]NNC60791.1 MarR family transcriptional regulator [Eudoraea sp.]NNK36455.1 MarR family transcriptional regulator [Eudoraea sp.]
MQELDLEIDLEKSLGPWLGKTIKITDYYLHEAFQQNGLDISKEQMIVLGKLNKNDGLNQNEIADLIWRDKSSIARLLAKMERKGYIIKRQHEQDRRVNLVYLTESGREIFRKTRPIIQKAINILEMDLSKSEINRMIEILKRIQDNFTKELKSL